MTDMSFTLVDSFDTDAPAISADHMGDGLFVLTEQLDDGKCERVCLTVAQIDELYARVCELYGERDLARMAVI
jgi:hypothetical protein